MQVVQLLFVASVDERHKLVCQAPSCGRAIAKAVHVIRDEMTKIRVVGSGCFGKLVGHERATEDGAVISGFDGRRLTPDERALMVADTAAFVASIEARLAAQKITTDLADAQRAETRGLREGQPEAPFHRTSLDMWRQRLADGSGAMRHGERRSALDQLARFRVQQAMQAARVAMHRRPELAAQSLDVVANAMVQAKAQYLQRGLRLDAPGAREAIEAEAVALLAKAPGNTTPG